MEFADWRGHVDKRLDAQDQTLSGIKMTLSDHVKKTAELRDNVETLSFKVNPVVDAMQTMKGGIEVIGWIGSKITAIGLTIAAIFGAITAWHNWK